MVSSCNKLFYYYNTASQTKIQVVPTKIDPPINTWAPAPSLTKAKNGSSFGFQPLFPEDRCSSGPIESDDDVEAGDGRNVKGDAEDEQIDEQSPDEDERQAFKVLQAPRKRRYNTVVNSGASCLLLVIRDFIDF